MRNAKPSVKENRMNAILDAATELLVEKPTASLNEIAGHAGIGIATLHRYIENRDQLMLKLGLRAVDVVKETMRAVPRDESALERYIPDLIEALIPLGDKIYFLAHDTSLNYSKELAEAEEVLKEPVRQTIKELQQQGYFRSDMATEWILNVLYWLLFVTWQQVQDGHVARKAAAPLVVDTLFNGVKASNAPLNK
ncbi:TetR/AcrR family transcriptional regulator [Paenibacillus pinihumi]|uniref:TetR/AcrR family transcriptional regulator n=1 Tax=Paenibacillus pinihumi TaxID=669462 RepID=UPI00048ED4BC|nr:TetR/AcrR family transcriptional regulator [Paenibacillus pinihumi]